MSKTASYVKDKYNAKTYDRYTFYMRKDEPLNDRLQADKQKKLISQAIKDALSLHYLGEEKQIVNTRLKTSKPTPNYTTKRQRRAAMKRITEQLQLIKAAEEQSRDNIPESFHSSPAYEAAEECINVLDEALELLASAY